ncbi:unnamed protein product [Paramecium sonneborni]|uniref:Uncharacterized protein n=1 Tax=Paramecium sonneborni TaxID=65129 RepID=A0A8S1RPG7_9CILI|nr:unnamed protein product [Paramecium sonneborni]
MRIEKRRSMERNNFKLLEHNICFIARMKMEYNKEHGSILMRIKRLRRRIQFVRIEIEKLMDLRKDFWHLSQVTYQGNIVYGNYQYEKILTYGLSCQMIHHKHFKLGNLKWQKSNSMEYYQYLWRKQWDVNGGGTFDYGDSEIMIGLWIEPSNGFFDQSQNNLKG